MRALFPSMMLVVYCLPLQVVAVSDCPPGCKCVQQTGRTPITVVCLNAERFPIAIPDDTGILNVTMTSGLGIQEGALAETRGIREVNIAGNVGPIQERAFADMDPAVSGTTRITFTNADITVIKKYAFFRVTGYDEISFINSNVKTLSSFAFKECSRIGTIRVSDTSIGTITTNSFYGMREIGAIIFQSSSVDVISRRAFFEIDDIVEVKFLNTGVNGGFVGGSFENIRGIDRIHFVDMDLKLSGGFLTNIVGTKSRKSDVLIERCHVPDIPNNSFDTITSFYNFKVRDSNIGTIHRNAIINIGDIENFVFSQTHIAIIMPQGITNITNIRLFAMRDMSVATIQPSGITRMSDIGIIDFTLISFGTLSNSSFANLKSIDVIKFESVTFNVIQTYAFAELALIGLVNFTEVTFPPTLVSNTFYDWRHISNVEFRSCTFNRLSNQVFNGFSSINSFEIIDSYLDAIASGAFVDFHCIKKFSVVESDVNRARAEIFKEFSEFELLSLRGNNIYNMRTDTFGVLHNIVNLDIRVDNNNFQVDPDIRVENVWDETGTFLGLDCEVTADRTNWVPRWSDRSVTAVSDQSRVPSTLRTTTARPPDQGFPLIYIIVIVVGVVVLLLIIVVVFCCYRKRKAGRKHDHVRSLHSLQEKRLEDAEKSKEIPPPVMPRPGGGPGAAYTSSVPLPAPAGMSSARPRISVPHEYLEVVSASGERVDGEGYCQMTNEQVNVGQGTYEYIDVKKMEGVSPASATQLSAPAYESLNFNPSQPEIYLDLNQT